MVESVSDVPKVFDDFFLSKSKSDVVAHLVYCTVEYEWFKYLIFGYCRCTVLVDSLDAYLVDDWC